MAANIAIIAITTNNSISVKAARVFSPGFFERACSDSPVGSRFHDGP